METVFFLQGDKNARADRQDPGMRELSCGNIREREKGEQAMNTIRSNKVLSFGALIDKGLSRQEIMKLKDIKTDAEYDRIYASLIEARKRAAWKQQERAQQRRR